MKATLLIFLSAAFLVLPWLSRREFYSRGEPREAIVAQSMLKSGDWLVGSGYSGAIPSKPPFTQWLMLAASMPFGEMSELSSRLPAALAFILFMAFFTYVIERETNDRQATFTAMLLLTSAEWFRAGVSTRVDTVLACCLAGGILSFHLIPRNKILFSGLCCLLLAFAVLTKGPIAIVLPAAIFGSFLLSKGHTFGASLLKVSAILIPVCVLSLWWYFAAFHQRGQAFFDKVFYENIQRFSSLQDDEPHKHSVFYLLASIPLGLLPWSLFVLPSLSAKLMRFRLDLAQLRKRLLELSDFERLTLLAIFWFIIFFSIPSSKRSVYLLPIYPFLAYWLAVLIFNFSARAMRAFAYIGYFFSLLIISVYIFVVSGKFGVFDTTALAARFKLGDDYGYMIHKVFALGAGLELYELLILCTPFFLALYLLSLFKRSQSEKLVIAVPAFFFAICLALNAVVLPVFANSISPKRFAELIATKLNDKSRLFSYDYEFYGLSFYLNRPIYRFEGEAKEGDMLLCYKDKLSELNSKLPSQVRIKILAQSDYPIENPTREVNLVKLGLERGT